MHSVLHGDVLGQVVKFLRKDPFGHSTLPGAIAETSFRGVGAGWARASRETRSELDVHNLTYNGEGLISSFSGGYLLGDPIDGTNQLALLLVRDPLTNRVECVGAQKSSAGWVSMRSHNLKQLTQLLGGHNADFVTRLDFMDSVYSGLKVREPLSAATRYQAIDTYQTNSGAPLNTYSTMIGFLTSGGFYRPQIALRNDVYFSVVKKVIRGVSSLSIALGYNDTPAAAECNGLIVSLYNHGLPKELVPLKLKNDPERHLRIMGRAALARHEEKTALKTALVVHQGGRSGRTRECASKGSIKVKRACREINSTHSSGRLRSWLQDDDSLEAEANGLVDDQYAAAEDCEADGDEADTDEDYSEEEDAKEPVRQTHLQRVSAMRRHVVFSDSDDASSDDEVDF